MRKDILKIAIKKFRQLSKKYNSFINIIVDDWRGFRFVYDSKDVRKCKNMCLKCSLYLLLKDEKKELFSAGLYPANEEDKKLFGKQNFLNCKSLRQYQNCYINFLVKKVKTKKEFEAEIKLIKNLKIIFSREDNINDLEKRFRDSIIKKIKRSAIHGRPFIER